MIRRWWWLLGFVLVALAQLALTLAPLFQQEELLRSGVPFKFRAEPVDPYDYLAGRYIQLGYALEDGAAFPGLAELVQKPGSYWAYAHLVTGADGYAGIDRLMRQRPTGGNYIRVKLWCMDRNKAFLRLPFDRYYLEEENAPAAERAYRRALGSRAKPQNAYALVRVKAGRAAMVELYLDGKPLREYLRENRDQNSAGSVPSS